MATKKFTTIKHTAYEIFLLLYKSLPLHSSPITSNPKDISTSLKNSTYIINNALICDISCKTQLINLATTFQFSNQFHFYTDGAVKALSTTECLSGYGCTQTLPSSPKLTFKGTLFFPSSTKSEAIAILSSAIITIPMGSNRTIFTDSANCINTFLRQAQTPSTVSTTTTQTEPLSNLKSYFSDHFHTKLNYNPQKSESTQCRGNALNDEADRLANEGCHSPHPIIVNFKFFKETSLGYFNWNNIYVVDRNIRKYADNPIRATIFNSLINNSSLSPISNSIMEGHIDWHYTKKWIAFNPFDSPTSEKFSKIQGTKIKKCNLIYPTLFKEPKSRNVT
jgi:hypothetical protein